MSINGIPIPEASSNQTQADAMGPRQRPKPPKPPKPTWSGENQIEPDPSRDPRRHASAPAWLTSDQPVMPGDVLFSSPANQPEPSQEIGDQQVAILESQINAHTKKITEYLQLISQRSDLSQSYQQFTQQAQNLEGKAQQAQNPSLDIGEVWTTLRDVNQSSRKLRLGLESFMENNNIDIPKRGASKPLPQPPESSTSQSTTDQKASDSSRRHEFAPAQLSGTPVYADPVARTASPDPLERLQSSPISDSPVLDPAHKGKTRQTETLPPRNEGTHQPDLDQEFNTYTNYIPELLRHMATQRPDLSKEYRDFSQQFQSLKTLVDEAQGSNQNMQDFEAAIRNLGQLEEELKSFMTDENIVVPDTSSTGPIQGAFASSAKLHDIQPADKDMPQVKFTDDSSDADADENDLFAYLEQNNQKNPQSPKRSDSVYSDSSDENLDPIDVAAQNQKKRQSDPSARFDQNVAATNDQKLSVDDLKKQITNHHTAIEHYFKNFEQQNTIRGDLRRINSGFTSLSNEYNKLRENSESDSYLSNIHKKLELLYKALQPHMKIHTYHAEIQKYFQEIESQGTSIARDDLKRINRGFTSLSNEYNSYLDNSQKGEIFSNVERRLKEMKESLEPHMQIHNLDVAIQTHFTELRQQGNLSNDLKQLRATFQGSMHDYNHPPADLDSGNRKQNLSNIENRLKSLKASLEQQKQNPTVAETTTRRPLPQPPDQPSSFSRGDGRQAGLTEPPNRPASSSALPPASPELPLHRDPGGDQAETSSGIGIENRQQRPNITEQTTRGTKATIKNNSIRRTIGTIWRIVGQNPKQYTPSLNPPPRGN